MRNNFIKLTTLLIFFLVFNNVASAQTDPLEKIKQDVLSGKMSIEQAKKQAVKISSVDSKNKSPKSLTQQNPMLVTSLGDKAKKAFFLTPSYIEFSSKMGIDSVAVINTSDANLYWNVINKSQGVKLLSSKGEEVASLNGELRAGERTYVSFKLDVPDDTIIPIEGVSYTLDFQGSAGDSTKMHIAYVPEIKKDKNSYFGYDVFRSQYKVNLEDIGPSSNEYIVSAGDNLTLNLWGQHEASIPLKVQSNGTVFIENSGQIMIAGETLASVKAKLTNIMSRSYSSLKMKNGKQDTQLDISLQKISSFPVYVVGAVRKPGMVRVNSLSTVFSALYACGGVKKEGTLRNIEVVRAGKVIATVDMYDYLCSGSLKSDIRLSAKDVVRVPFRKSTVHVSGEINRPMIYELKDKETLADLVKYAGGTKSTTDPSIVVIDRLAPQASNKQLRTTIKEELGKISGSKLIVNKLPIYDTDEVEFYSLSGKNLNYVDIKGAVYREGKYAIKDGMTIQDVLDFAGGLKEDAYKNKAELIRTFADGTLKFENIDFTDAASLAYKVQSRDSIKVYSTWDLKLKRYVSVEGYLPKAGKFLFAENMHVSDLIIMAGGLEDEVYRKTTHLERADLIRYNEDGLTTKIVPIKLLDVLLGNKAANIAINPGDRLIIYSAGMTFHKEMISIEGAVNNPGEFEKQTNMTVKDIIVQAGGFKHSAFRASIEVFRVDPFNISTEKLSSVQKVELEDGLLTSFEKKDNFELKDRDIVVVRQYPKYQYQRKVVITGEVKYPGTYTLLKEKETFSELIERAGGLTNEAYVDATYIKRDSQRLAANFEKVMTGKEKHNVILKQGDNINIPKHPGVVTVEGFVNSPGIVQYRKGWSAKDYIEAAGNYTFDANKARAMIYYPGGNAKRRRFICGFAKVKEGCVIKVPRKEIKPVTFWLDFTSKLSSVIASVVTTIYIVKK